MVKILVDFMWLVLIVLFIIVYWVADKLHKYQMAQANKERRLRKLEQKMDEQD